MSDAEREGAYLATEVAAGRVQPRIFLALPQDLRRELVDAWWRRGGVLDSGHAAQMGQSTAKRRRRGSGGIRDFFSRG
jgi:hypothetical protein